MASSAPSLAGATISPLPSDDIPKPRIEPRISAPRRSADSRDSSARMPAPSPKMNPRAVGRRRASKAHSGRWLSTPGVGAHGVEAEMEVHVFRFDSAGERVVHDALPDPGGGDGEVVAPARAGRGHGERRSPGLEHRGEIRRNGGGHDAGDRGRQDANAPAARHPAHHFAVGLDLPGTGADHHGEIACWESRLVERDPCGAHCEEGHAPHETCFRAIQPELPWVERIPIRPHELAPGLALDPGFVHGKGDLGPGLERVPVRGDSGTDLGQQPHPGDDRIPWRGRGEGRF